MTRAPLGAGVVRGEHGGDAVALDQDRAAFEDRAGFVHDHDCAAIDEDRAVLCGWTARGRTTNKRQERGEYRNHEIFRTWP